MPAKRPCPTPGCPHLITPTQRRCPTCATTYEQRRGSRQARGYDKTHDKLRAQWASRIANGEPITCARCGQPVYPWHTWDLGHTDDRTGYNGPEHAACNRAAGGRHGAQTSNRT